MKHIACVGVKGDGIVDNRKKISCRGDKQDE